eukprot:TRINITY_DN7262_c0_g1_i7.p1 TRINITY_DN7262_c0_g1~~TRINITY_DN7262_c0_g1_i7.p1  ORF type:complete len:123 (-),score=12.51 TRINITY_DN7262_c0_g1_i7:69-437(-)
MCIRDRYQRRVHGAIKKKMIKQILLVTLVVQLAFTFRYSEQRCVDLKQKVDDMAQFVQARGITDQSNQWSQFLKNLRTLYESRCVQEVLLEGLNQDCVKYFSEFRNQIQAYSKEQSLSLIHI